MTGLFSMCHWVFNFAAAGWYQICCGSFVSSCKQAMAIWTWYKSWTKKSQNNLSRLLKQWCSHAYSVYINFTLTWLGAPIDQPWLMTLDHLDLDALCCVALTSMHIFSKKECLPHNEHNNFTVPMLNFHPPNRRSKVRVIHHLTMWQLICSVSYCWHQYHTGGCPV